MITVDAAAGMIQVERGVATCGADNGGSPPLPDAEAAGGERRGFRDACGQMRLRGKARREHVGRQVEVRKIPIVHRSWIDRAA